MSEPIYKFFRGRFLPDWYQLSKEEQSSLVAKLNEGLEKVGGKRLALCDSSLVLGSMIGEWIRGIPNIEAVHKYTATLNELKWFRSCESTSLLGTKLES